MRQYQGAMIGSEFSPSPDVLGSSESVLTLVDGVIYLLREGVPVELGLIQLLHSGLKVSQGLLFAIAHSLGLGSGSQLVGTDDSDKSQLQEFHIRDRFEFKIINKA